MSNQPRQCAECGSDRWMARDYQRLRDANYRLSKQNDKLAAERGILINKLELQRLEHQGHVSRLQQKVSRQARVIVRMERRLRELRQRPYEGAPLGESAPAAEYDTVNGDA